MPNTELDEEEYFAWQKTEDPARDELPETKALMEALALSPGMQVADIGAGWGYHVFKVSSLVGPEGRVYATDTDAEAIEIMTSYRDANGNENVEVLRVRPDAHGLGHLEPGSLDRIIMINSAIFSGGPDDDREREYLGSFKELLGPGGFLIYVNGQLDLEKLKALFSAAGFSRVEELTYPQSDANYEKDYPESFAEGLPFSFMLKAHR